MASSQSIRKGQVPVKCGLCETDRTIKWKCLDCDLFLCNHCKEKVHFRVKTAKDHKVIDIKDIGIQQNELDFANIPCQNHAGEYNCHFCKTCDTLVCQTCVMKSHKKHILTEIQEEYDVKIDRLKKGLSKIQTDRKEIVSRNEQLVQLSSAKKYNQANQDISKQEKVVKAAVESCFKQLRDKLDQHQKNIKSDLNAVSVLLQKADDKNKNVLESIRMTEASKFFKVVNNLEKNMDTKMPEPRSTNYSMPNFVPGEIYQSNIGMLKFDDNLADKPHIRLDLNNQYETNFLVGLIVFLGIDQSFWISSGRFGLVQKVKTDGNKLKIISSFNIRLFGVAVTQSNNLLVNTGMKLQQMNGKTGALTDTVYNVSPLRPTAVYTTSNNKLLIGGMNIDFSTPGKRVVILMNQNGVHERVYEHDQHQLPMFKYPYKITTTSNGNIFVLDRINDNENRIVVLGQGGDLINTYTGIIQINKDQPFAPEDIVTTPRDNVIAADMRTHSLHILNNAGLLMTFYKTSDIGILFPWSLAFSPTGKLYIAKSGPEASEKMEVNLYEVTISGC
ncbi:E3 ubiquitin-protein ligase TRIM71-like [Mytilus edulis]|uniref:E3 ubiquitin-protein ligase TRIM71-like n=1 Tax=Mytilus edulis TaxID=6550 RepID=UPI0039EEEA47